MARPKSDKPKRKIADRDITGLKYFEKQLSIFERLHEVGCARDTAGNRDLHFFSVPRGKLGGGFFVWLLDCRSVWK